MSKYEYAIDFDAIDAIDIHAHVEIDGCGHRSIDDELMAASEEYFKSGAVRTPTIYQHPRRTRRLRRLPAISSPMSTRKNRTSDRYDRHRLRGLPRPLLRFAP